MQRRDFIATLSAAAAWVAAVVSFSAAQTTFQPLPFKQFLEENGWVSLPLPDKRMGPGSIIKVTKKDGAVTMQWLGDLRRCGITDREFGYVRGKYPAIGIRESFGVKASVAAGYIAKLEGTADLEKAGDAIMQIDEFRWRCRRFRRIRELDGEAWRCATDVSIVQQFFGPRRYLSRQRGLSHQQGQIRPRR